MLICQYAFKLSNVIQWGNAGIVVKRQKYNNNYCNVCCICRYIMAELLQTERVYVRDLQECIEVNMANMISQVHQEKHSWCFTAASNTEHKSVVKTLRCIFSDTNLTSYTTQNSSELKSLIFSADFGVREREFYQPVFCC